MRISPILLPPYQRDAQLIHRGIDEGMQQRLGHVVLHLSSYNVEKRFDQVPHNLAERGLLLGKGGIGVK